LGVVVGLAGVFVVLPALADFFAAFFAAFLDALLEGGAFFVVLWLELVPDWDHAGTVSVSAIIDAKTIVINLFILESPLSDN
jgi:hypothetical protein